MRVAYKLLNNINVFSQMHFNKIGLKINALSGELVK